MSVQSRAEAIRVWKLENLRCSSILLGISNAAIAVLGGFLIVLAYPVCERRNLVPFVVVSLASCIRIVIMVQSGIAQEATARNILQFPDHTAAVVDLVIRHERRLMYKRWLWWTRFALIVTVLQIFGAIYFIFHMVGYIAYDGTSSSCALGVASSDRWWKQKLLVTFMFLVCFVALVQCFTGMDILRWRSFYATEDHAWKAHYSEMFDHGIREALCCLGRVKYLSAMDEDEVFSVAQLLGDLVAYRSSGTGHLEFLAGLALMQRRDQLLEFSEELMEAPLDQIQEAVFLHKFAEAAYTGPLLDFGRKLFLFPCAWLYRQGILTPWTRNKRPILHGDNWWRGHAAAFLRHVQLSPEVLLRGRVNQANCQAAYFVLVLHDVKCVVISVRGTETPEDLITDGLCRECSLSEEDLDGLFDSTHVHPCVKQRILSSFPHYAHSGIVEAARELFMQIEGNANNDESEPCGLISSLVGAGCECDGYKVRVVGHSLGGSVAALLGLRLYRRCPNLRVYAYGPLPCVDSIVASACSEFVTSIVFNDEFSARLSVESIRRLRAAAITALSQDSKDNSTLIFQLARRFLYLNHYQRNGTENPQSGTCSRHIRPDDQGISRSYHQNDTGEGKEAHVFSLLAENQTENTGITMEHGKFSNPSDPVSQFMRTVERSESDSTESSSEMYLPGLIIHIVPQERGFALPLWNSFTGRNDALNYKAYIASRESFKHIIVSPFMFLDHLPWRCHDALQKVLEAETPTELLHEASSIV